MKFIKIPIAWIIGTILLIITAIIMIPTFVILFIAHKLNLTFEYDSIDEVLLYIWQFNDKVYRWSVS